jgi:hypothetical protein
MIKYFTNVNNLSGFSDSCDIPTQLVFASRVRDWKAGGVKEHYIRCKGKRSNFKEVKDFISLLNLKNIEYFCAVKQEPNFKNDVETIFIKEILK